MTKNEFCIATRKAEFPAFVRVLKAMPQDRLDYRPDPKARTAAVKSSADRAFTIRSIIASAAGLSMPIQLRLPGSDTPFEPQ